MYEECEQLVTAFEKATLLARELKDDGERQLMAQACADACGEFIASIQVIESLERQRDELREELEDEKAENGWAREFLNGMAGKCGTADCPSLVAYVRQLEAFRDNAMDVNERQDAEYVAQKQEIAQLKGAVNERDGRIESWKSKAHEVERNLNLLRNKLVEKNVKTTWNAALNDWDLAVEGGIADPARIEEKDTYPRGKDGKPLKYNDLVFGEDGKGWRVRGWDYTKSPYCVVAIGYWDHGTRRELKPGWLTHERPDNAMTIVHEMSADLAKRSGCSTDEYEVILHKYAKEIEDYVNRRTVW